MGKAFLCLLFLLLRISIFAKPFGDAEKDSVNWLTKISHLIDNTATPVVYPSDSTIKGDAKFEYFDSVFKAQNKFRVENIFLGYRYSDAQKRYSILLEPLIYHVAYNTVQGLAIDPTIGFDKKLTDTKSYQITARVGYGFSNKIMYGDGKFSYNYNQNRFAKISLSAGKDILQFNNNAISPIVNTLYTLLLKDNFIKLFEKYFTRIEHQTEITNGLITISSVEYSDRNPLLNTSNFSIAKSDKEFRSNDPQKENNQGFAFKRNQSFDVSLALRFTPYQKYFFAGGKKQIMESHYPTFTVFYKRAIPIIWRSDVDLDLLKLGFEGKLKFKRLGALNYSIEGGYFLNRTSMTFMDWKYFNGNQTLYSSFTGKDFQLLDYYTNSTNYQYAEAHLEYNFNGFFLNKIPLISKAKIQELITANFLLTNNRVQYTELGIGLKKSFVRVDYVFGLGQGNYISSGLRFGFIF